MEQRSEHTRKPSRQKIDFGKPTKLSHLVFRETTILNIEATVVLLCWTVATPDILYNRNSPLASVLQLHISAS